PTPSRAAADLVVFAGERLDTEVRTSLPKLRVGFVGVGRQAHVLVGTRALANPSLRAVLQIEGSDTAASGELVTTEADDHLVIGDQWSGGDGLALLRVGVFDDPDFLAGLAVEGNHEAVEGAIHELAVGIGTTAVDGVAASARNSGLVTVSRLHVLPDRLRVVRISQIESLHHVAV